MAPWMSSPFLRHCQVSSSVLDAAAVRVRGAPGQRIWEAGWVVMAMSSWMTI